MNWSKDGLTAIWVTYDENRYCEKLKAFYGKFASDDNRCLIIDGEMKSFAPAGLRSYSIPNSVTSIGEAAFTECSSLVSVVIPNSVTTIGFGAFSACSNLSTVEIPNSVNTIGDAAFWFSGLTSVEIPNSVTTIGKRIFTGCRRLEAFYGKFSSEDNRCLIEDGVLKAFAPAGLTSYSIPNSISSIGDYAFYFCEDLTSVEIPNSVTKIGENAFGATDLTSVEIPNSVTTIGDEAFWCCYALTSVVIGNSVSEIGYSAFGYDSELKEIVSTNPIPPTTYDAFYGVSKTDCVVKVPEGSVEDYKAAPEWKDFLNIEVYFPTNISAAQAADAQRQAVYNLAGQRVDEGTRGIVVKNGRKVLNR